MPRFEQTTAYGINPVQPTTAGKIPVFLTTGNPAKASNSNAFAEADSGHQVLIGVNAAANAGQVAGTSTVIVGEGAGAWGDGTVAIGEGAQAGQTAAKDGAIAIGSGAVVNAKNAIKIGSQLAFGAGAGDDAVIIGTQAACNGNAGIAVGRGAIGTVNAIAIGHTASTNGTTEAIAIGHNATGANTGVNHFGIAIGVSANAGTNNGESAIAIGHNATATNALAAKTIAIGDGATITAAVSAAIALGAGAGTTVQPIANEFLCGDSLNGNHIAIVTFRSLAANPVRHRVGASGGWAIRDAANANDIFEVDSSATANDVRLRVWDVSAAALRRVTIGAANSGGAGFRTLIIPN